MKDLLIRSIRDRLAGKTKIQTKSYYILVYRAGEIICRKSDDKSFTLCSMGVSLLEDLKQELCYL